MCPGGCRWGSAKLNRCALYRILNRFHGNAMQICGSPSLLESIVLVYKGLRQLYISHTGSDPRIGEMSLLHNVLLGVKRTQAHASNGGNPSKAAHNC